MHPETEVGPAATAPISQHGEEGFFVDGVLAFAQTFRATFVGGTKTIVCLAAQTNESVAAPFHLAWTYSSLCLSQHSAGNHSDLWRK